MMLYKTYCNECRSNAMDNDNLTGSIMKFETLKVQLKTFTALVQCKMEEQDMCKELSYKPQRTMTQVAKSTIILKWNLRTGCDHMNITDVAHNRMV